MMGFTLTIEGSGRLYFGEDIIQSVQTGLSSWNRSRAKSTDNYATMWITGHLHGDGAGGTNSETIELFHWSRIPAEDATAYRNVTVQIVAADQIYREINFHKAFVVEYEERYSATAGVGTFSLVVRQKTDQIDEVKVM